MMKKTILAAAIAFTTAFGTQAIELHQPDRDYIEASTAVGVSQSNWDSGQSAKLTFKNAYRYTYNLEMSKGEFTHDLGKAKGFDLTGVKGHDVDGELPMDVLLRDRLNIESLVLLKDGQLVDEYYWSGMDKDHLHLMMSVTKSFTALTVQTLVQEGKIELNKLISDYLPELKQSGFADATVQEVLDMRSGVKIEFTPGKIWDERMTNVQEWNGVNNYPQLNSILDFAATLGQRSDVQTGQAFDYQCVNTEVLGMLIQRVTGMSAGQAMEERLWKRVGFEHNARLQSNSQGEAVMSGGLNATTRDAAIMMDVLVNGGKNRAGEQILAPEYIDNLMNGNDEVKSAWKHDGFSALLADAWYKDQFRVLNVGGHRYILMVGIHGQVIVGEPATGKVIAMNGAQDEMQAVRTVSMLMIDAVPALLDAIQ
ncbi:serine hydrolase domain-containing protein [Vibrio agarivorans]|uniref:serine hydrolase domain-containing protein n=1 Tax=Vibrio agarivorans TaxID=153622 RepID=UPI00222FFC84|nr:serine hydrolase [Vibrio agarivorans]MDN3659701.1 serine hydrolase [Vibrio agarivorans]